MKKELFIYFLKAVAVYLTIYLIELFLYENYLTFIGDFKDIKTIIYILSLVVVNPILTAFVVNRLKIKRIFNIK